MKHESDILKRIKSYFMRRNSAGESHAFEREAERDVFLYEALEGLEDMLTSDIQQSLDELDDRLDDRARKKSLFFTWQAAAVVAIIVGGTAVFSLLGIRDQSGIENTAVEPDPTYSPRSQQPQFDSLDQIHYTSSEPSPEEAISDGLTKVKEVPDDAVAYQDEMPKPVVKALKAEDLPEVKPTKTVTPAAPKNETPQITVKQNEVASAAVPQVQIATESDRSVELMEKVVTTKRSSAPAAQPEPVGGMAAYQSYLKRNLKQSSSMPAGTVVLSFEFERDGTPKKIEVLNSLCTACDAEAIRLISSGPKWEAEDRKERVSVSVSFEP
jgi:cytoskeletal protein RodZ